MPGPTDLRAAWWTWNRLRACRRALRVTGLRTTVPAPPAGLPAEAIRGVRAVVRRTDGTCLERSLVLQRWHASHGNPVEIVVGVPKHTGPSGAFGSSGNVAHAWLTTETTPALLAEYNVIHTLQSPSADPPPVPSSM